MRKIFFLGIIIFFIMAISQKSMAANSYRSSVLVDKSIKKNRLSGITQKNYEQTITIGWTDVCGVCHDYTISGTWSQIWQIVGFIDLYYEMGYCGTLIMIPNPD